MAAIRHLRQFVCSAAAVAGLAVAGGCAGPSAPQPVPMTEPATMGALDAVYDRSKWHWIRNADGRQLLTHAVVRQCFVDPDPELDYTDPEFTLEREQKTIGKTRYDVLNVHEGRDFWIAVYKPVGAKRALLGVYADGPCRAEAERILQAYEKK